MREAWIECVPNFSEGRDVEKVSSIAYAAGEAGATVLDVHMDPDHNRSVVTFVARPDRAVEAAFRAVERAVATLDLSQHSGVHPRVGVADVVPFVPLTGVSREQAVAAAEDLAQRLARELNLPVYLYEWAARRREYHNLAEVRRLHGEALRSGEGLIAPDAGPNRPHPTAGATVVGARAPLVAFNCLVAPADARTAKRIAAATRERGGGPRGVKALGLWLAERDAAQVSMNLTDVEATPPHVAVDHVERLAEREGSSVIESELVGLIPLDSVLRAAADNLHLAGLEPRQVLELAIVEKGNSVDLDRFLSDLASSAPAPGGGAASALVGALAAALASMVCNLTIGRPAYAAVDEQMRDTLGRTETLRLRLRQLMQEDEAAYSALMAQYALPKDTEEQQRARGEAIEQALRKAADVPLEAAGACIEVLKLLRTIAGEGNKNAISDAATGALLAEAAARASLLNVRVNAGLMKDRAAAADYLARMENAQREVAALASEAIARATDRMG